MGGRMKRSANRHKERKAERGHGQHPACLPDRSAAQLASPSESTEISRRISD